MGEELYHYGVIGQKWHVRRTPEQLGHKKLNESKKSSIFFKKRNSNKTKQRITKNKKTSYSTESIKTSHKKKSVKKMSDEELNKAIQRLELEKKYKDLDRSVNSKTTSRGKKIVYDVLETSGKNIAVQATAYGLGTLVNTTVSNLTNGKHKNIVDPKNIQKKKK